MSEDRAATRLTQHFFGALLLVITLAIVPNGVAASRIEISYELSDRDIQIQFDDREGVHRISLTREENLVDAGLVGAPSLPALHRSVLLPENSRLENITVVLGDPVVVGSDIFPDWVRNTEGGSTVRDSRWYDEGRVFPPNPGIVRSNGSFRGLCLADVAAMPFEWDSETKKLLLYRSIDILVDYGGSAEIPTRHRRDRRFSRKGYELDWVRKNVANPDALESYLSGTRREGMRGASGVTEQNPGSGFSPTTRPSLQGPAVEMVIITGTEWANGTPTDGDMESAWQELADWKTLTGTPTVVRTVQWIRTNYPAHDDPASIRLFLIEAYENWSTDFAILGGDDVVVPVRAVSPRTNPPPSHRLDYPTQWYYASLEGAYDADDLEPFYLELPVPNMDWYPEIWVGRIPVRDGQEVSDYVQKLKTYEHAPGTDRPSEPFYRSFLSAAAFTNSGAWGNAPDRWSNGIWLSEEIIQNVADSLSLSYDRLYPSLPAVADCGGQTFECWDEMKDYFTDDFTGLSTYPSGRMTASAISDSLDSGYGFFFHCEHSFFHILGGPATGDSIIVPLGECDDTSCTDCETWGSSCLSQYAAGNSSRGVDREMVETLTNGPEYTVGLTYGSATGRHEIDSIVERIVRSGQGGAICMAAKSVSANSAPSNETKNLTYQYFAGILHDRVPPGVALLGAVSKKKNRLSRDTWHFFGDPSMEAWDEKPDILVVTGPDTLTVGGSISLTVTVEDGTSNPVKGAIVTVSRDNNVFVIGATDASGGVTFPAVTVLHDEGPLIMWAKADGFEPATGSIVADFKSTANPTHPVIYTEHTWLDSGGRVADVLESGDDIDLRVLTTNKANQSVTGGVARLFASPRVRASLMRDGSQIPNGDIYFGAGKANPPEFADTVDFALNEHGIRPEGDPVGTLSDDSIYVWRDSFGRYYLQARHGAEWDGSDFNVVVWAEGGLDVDVGETELDGADSYTVFDDRIELSLDGDLADVDQLAFFASAQDWIVWTDSTEIIPTMAGQDTASFEFELEASPLIPDQTRLGFSLVTDGSPFEATTSDFFLDFNSPVLVLNGGNVSECPSCGCFGCPETLFEVDVSVRNLGSVEGEAMVTLGSVTGANSVCTGSAWFVVPADGEEIYTFTVCDTSAADFEIGSLTVDWRVNGEVNEAESWSSLDWTTMPGTIHDLVVDSTPGGFIARWEPPTVTAGVQGYHVYLRKDGGAPVKITPRPIGKARKVLTELDRFGGTSQIDHQIGVVSVGDDWSQSDVAWSDTNLRVFWAEAAGWPKRMPKGSVSSVVPFNTDADDSLEIIAGGQVIAIWNADGSSATGDSTGLLYDPSTPGAVTQHYWGNLAVGNIDADSEIEIAGSYGDDNLRVVQSNGDVQFVRFTRALSTPTFADLDGDGDKEVLVQAWSGDLYAFEEDGASYSATSDGLFADPGSDFQYSQTGISVADADTSHLVVIQTTQREASNARIFAWIGEDGVAPNPDQLWPKRYLAGGNRQAAPVVADVDADGELEIVSRTARDDSTIVTYDLLTGAVEKVWSWSDEVFSGGAGPFRPGVGDLGGGDELEIVFAGTADVAEYSVDTWLMMAYFKTDGSIGTVTGVDEIILPGRREMHIASTIGAPLIVDFDDDGKVEVLVASDQGAVFAFEAIWNGEGTGSFTLDPEPDWPIVFAATPMSMSVADVDDDGMLELLVATDDGYVHRFDFPGATVKWAMAAGNADRTGYVPLTGARQSTTTPAAVADMPTLGRVGPNPFGQRVSIRYQIPYDAEINIVLYDVSGRRVRTLIDSEWMLAGESSVEWDGLNDFGQSISSGTYFAKIRLGDRNIIRKIVRTR